VKKLVYYEYAFDEGYDPYSIPERQFY
jgi:hypothetical protein